MTSRTIMSSRTVVVITAVLLAVLSIAWRGLGTDGQAWRHVIGGDAEGYHAYMEGLVVQGDLAHVRTAEHHFAPAGDGRVIKYFCGTALLQAPFTITAHVVALALGTADGRSLPYAIAIMLAGWFYAVCGMLGLRAVLRGLGLHDGDVAFTLALLVLGTGLPYYAVITPGMAHVYGFAMLAWALACAQRAFRSPHAPALTLLGAAIALLILVRPTDALALLALPAALRRDGSLRTSLPRAGTLLVPTLVTVALLALQPLLWHAQCGAWWVSPYAGEGFLWDRPMTWSLLFGARKGLFFYWPLLLLVVPGLFVLLRHHRIAAIALITALGATTYVIGCWWIWYYGYSYGARPFIDLLPLFALPIAHLADGLLRSGRGMLLLSSVPLMGLQLFQCWQYEAGLIHPYNMDREKYRMIFLRTDPMLRDAFGGAGRVPPYAPHGLRTVASIGHAGDTLTWSGGRWSGAPSAIHAALDSTEHFTPALIVRNGLPTEVPLFVEVSLRSRALDRGTTANARLVCTYRNGEQERDYQSWPVNDLPLSDDRGWRPWRYSLIMPAPTTGDELRCYVWLNGPGRMEVRDLRIRVSCPR